MTTPQHENQVYCSRCEQWATLDHFAPIVQRATSGRPTPYESLETVTVLKHKRCHQPVFIPALQR